MIVSPILCFQYHQNTGGSAWPLLATQYMSDEHEPNFANYFLDWPRSDDSGIGRESWVGKRAFLVRDTSARWEQGEFVFANANVLSILWPASSQYPSLFSSFSPLGYGVISAACQPWPDLPCLPATRLSVLRNQHRNSYPGDNERATRKVIDSLGNGSNGQALDSNREQQPAAFVPLPALNPQLPPWATDTVSFLMRSVAVAVIPIPARSSGWGPCLGAAWQPAAAVTQPSGSGLGRIGTGC